MYMWACSLDDVIMAMELAYTHGKKEGESFEEEFLYIMKLKQNKPICKTDLSYQELITDFNKKRVKAVDFHKLVEQYKKYKKGDKND